MNPTTPHRYRPDIDGLRALAVLAVLFYHAGFPAFSGGYVGVDVFFVISGYLITGIIWRELQAGQFSLARFYERRLRRIFPALYFVLTFVLLGALWLYPPQRLLGVVKSALATVGFASNLLFWSESGYFDAPSALKPLLHTWSLAVEEQFYLVFPWLLWLGWRYARRRFRLLYWGVLVGSFAWGWWTLGRDPSAAFYFFHLRAWELMLGGALALGYVPALKGRASRELAAWLGLGLVLFSIFTFREDSLFPGWRALLPVLGTALMMHSHQPQAPTWLERGLSLRPLVWVGKISYSLYLWHWPLLLYAKTWLLRAMRPAETLAVLGLAGLLAAFSWRWVENPFRRKDFLTRRQVFQLGGAVMLVFAVWGGLLWQRTTAALAADPEPYAMYHCDEENPNRLAGQGLGVCALGAVENQAVFALWGDSHAAALAPAASAAAEALGQGGVVLSESGCAPLVGIERPSLACGDHAQRVLRYLAEHPQIQTVYLTARWQGYQNVTLSDGLGELPAYSDNLQLIEAGLRRSITALQEMGRRVVLVQPVPDQRYPVPEAYYVARRTGRDVNALIAPSAAVYARQNAAIRDLLARMAADYHLSLLDPAEILCASGRCLAADPEPLYYDANHLNFEGAARLTPLFRDSLLTP